VIIFGSVQFLYKKKIKPKFKKKIKTGSNRPVAVCFLGQKPVQTGLAWFFSLAWFFGSARFFSGLAWFFSVSVRFGSVWFFQLFFSSFLCFSVFLLTYSS
jgi:hypothetical protein